MADNQETNSNGRETMYQAISRVAENIKRTLGSNSVQIVKPLRELSGGSISATEMELHTNVGETGRSFYAATGLAGVSFNSKTNQYYHHLGGQTPMAMLPMQHQIDSSWEQDDPKRVGGLTWNKKFRDAFSAFDTEGRLDVKPRVIFLANIDGVDTIVVEFSGVYGPNGRCTSTDFSLGSYIRQSAGFLKAQREAAEAPAEEPVEPVEEAPAEKPKRRRSRAKAGAGATA